MNKISKLAKGLRSHGKRNMCMNAIEFELMSDTLSSINFEDKLTDGQYVAICYFATLHNVTPFDVVGIDGKEAVERYMRSLNDDVDVSILKSKASDTKDATRKFREAGIKKASELADK